MQPTEYNFWITQKARRFGYSIAAREYALRILSNGRRQYQLKRIKSRLRVSFIGYSYNIKFK